MSGGGVLCGGGGVTEYSRNDYIYKTVLTFSSFQDRWYHKLWIYQKTYIRLISLEHSLGIHCLMSSADYRRETNV